MYHSEKTGVGRGAERCGVRVARHRFLTHVATTGEVPAHWKRCRRLLPCAGASHG
jgi:hypothetical protein